MKAAQRDKKMNRPPKREEPSLMELEDGTIIKHHPRGREFEAEPVRWSDGTWASGHGPKDPNAKKPAKVKKRRAANKRARAARKAARRR